MVSCKVTLYSEKESISKKIEAFVDFVKNLNYNGKVQVQNDANNKIVDANSLEQMMSLEPTTPSVLSIYCDGENEKAILLEVVNAIRRIDRDM